MYFLAYLSSAGPKMTEDDLIDILVASRKRNSQNNITGMLLFIENNIIQVLEGEEHDVIQLFSKIEQDRRHVGIIKIMEGNEPERMFKDWSMGFKSTTYEDLSNFTGYKNITKDLFLPMENEANDHPALQVLKLFYENYQKANR